MMPTAPNASRERSLQGTAVVMLAESLALPTGIAVAAILTRKLGPEDYGSYSLAATVITTLEWVLLALLSPPAIKFIAEASDWRPVAATTFRAHVGVGLATGLVVWLLADPTAGILHDEALTGYLRLFALEIPLFAAAAACRSVLTGLAHFRQQAVTAGGQWLGRLALIALFVGIGWNANGAILGNIGGVMVAWALGQFYVGRSVLGRASFSGRVLFQLAVPTFLLTLSVRLFHRLGLLALKALGGSAVEAGLYGAAQNLLVLSGIVNRSMAPILISTITAGQRTAEQLKAKHAATVALRLGFWTFPFTAIVSGASGEVVEILFGAAFANAAPLVAVLIVGTAAMVLIAIASALLVALGRPWPAVLLTAPLLPLSVLGYVLVVPRLGALGAALVTTTTALLAASLCVVVVCLVWPLRPPVAAIVRSAIVSSAVYTAAATWPTPGPMLIVKGLVLSLGVVVAAGAMREFTSRDLAWIRTARHRGV